MKINPWKRVLIGKSTFNEVQQTRPKEQRKRGGNLGKASKKRTAIGWPAILTMEIKAESIALTKNNMSKHRDAV